jgi:hypothetical protein
MHKYTLGQSVHYSGEGGPHNVPGEYEIVRLLPEDAAGDPQYRLRRKPDGPERVVREHMVKAKN